MSNYDITMKAVEKMAVDKDRERIKEAFSDEIIKNIGDNWTYGQIKRFIISVVDDDRP